VLGLEPDPRFATFADWQRNSAELIALLEERFCTEPVRHWLSLLEPAGVPCGPVNDVEAAHPHSLARGLIVQTDHPRYGAVS
jgi:crotonobetainyl-CoA:carnitine CoA-transferase CaiB-like acyl-CoA transferase